MVRFFKNSVGFIFILTFLFVVNCWTDWKRGLTEPGFYTVINETVSPLKFKRYAEGDTYSSFPISEFPNFPIKHINFIANFRFKDDDGNLGGFFLAAIFEQPINPGEISKTFILKSKYGVEGKTLAAFKYNPYWKVVIVILLVQQKESKYNQLGEWEFSKKKGFKKLKK